jgi:hypothetical protein
MQVLLHNPTFRRYLRGFCNGNIWLRVSALIGLLPILLTVATLPRLFHDWTTYFTNPTTKAVARGHQFTSIDSAFFETVVYSTVVFISVRALTKKHLWFRSRILEVVSAMLLLYELSYAALVATEWRFVHSSERLLAIATVLYTPIDRLGGLLSCPTLTLYNLFR